MRDQRASVRRSFNDIAEMYATSFADELDRKPFDREVLESFAAEAADPIIDVGCGPGHVGHFVAERGRRVAGADFSDQALLQGRKLFPEMPFVAADACRMPFKDASVGAICSYYCLIYGQALDALKEFRRALRPDGSILIAVHAGDETQHVEDWNGTPVDITMHHYNPEDFAALVAECGFGIDRMHVREPYEGEHATRRIYVWAHPE